MKVFIVPILNAYHIRTNFIAKENCHAVPKESQNNISEAKEDSTSGGFLCEEKQAIQTSNDMSEAHEAFYKAILKRYK